MRGGHEYRLHINDKAERLLGAPCEIIEFQGGREQPRHQFDRLKQCRLDDEAQVIWFNLRAIHRDAPSARRPKGVILNRVVRLPTFDVSVFAVVNSAPASSATTLSANPCVSNCTSVTAFRRLHEQGERTSPVGAKLEVGLGHGAARLFDPIVNFAGRNYMRLHPALS